MPEWKGYLKNLVFPVLWHVLFLIAFFFVVGEQYRIYVNVLYYFGLILYFAVVKRDFSFPALWRNWRNKRFWPSVLLAAVGFALAFVLGDLLIPSADDGIRLLKVNDGLSLAAFAASTVFFPPIAEELFFRKNIIRFDSKAVLVVTAIVGMLLYASEHALNPLGMLKAMIWAVPLTIAYIKTKNIYVSMTAHFVCNLIFNGSTAVMVLYQLMRY